MVEVNPRPRKQPLFVQVSVAVVSGAAAMSFIQTVLPGSPSAPPPRAAAPAVRAEPQRPSETAPAAVREPSASQADDDSSRFRSAPPAAVSMMVVPEDGGANAGIVAIGDDAPPSPAAAAAAPAAEKAAPEKKSSVIHLQKSGLRSRYSGGVGHEFQAPALAPHVFAKKEAPKEAPPPAPPKSAPHYITAPKALSERGVPQKDVFVPSVIHPEDVPDEPFWTYERKRKAVVAGLIALSGLIYFLVVLGFFNSIVAKPRDDDEPRP